jgi:hypothetical protein
MSPARVAVTPETLDIVNVDEATQIVDEKFEG